MSPTAAPWAVADEAVPLAVVVSAVDSLVAAVADGVSEAALVLEVVVLATIVVVVPYEFAVSHHWVFSCWAL